MGVWAWQALFFELQPFYSEKLFIFSKSSNDITNIFWNSLLGPTYQKCQEPMCPDNTEVLSLAMFSIEDLHLHLAYNFSFWKSLS